MEEKLPLITGIDDCRLLVDEVKTLANINGSRNIATDSSLEFEKCCR